jgi:hypothetical protein
MSVFDRLFGFDKRLAEVEKRTVERLTTHLDDALLKASVPQGAVQRYQFDNLNTNGGIYSRKKPDSQIPFDVLRKFSQIHEITRAAINYRKRQITGLEWEIITADTQDTADYSVVANDVTQFFKEIGGPGNNYRKFMGKLIEDLLVLDAIALYKRQTMGGGLYTLEPIDAATIRLRVADDGSTPLPPEPAYIQVIRGQKVEEFTVDELIYEMMNPRTNSPYGLAPLESLMVTVSSSLKAGIWNLTYMTDGNIPEGFYGVPKEWTQPQIADFQKMWDGIMAGDEAQMAKLKFVPEGSYQPTKKPNDMAWEVFNDWLMKITCALFDVTPMELGFSPKSGLGGKGMAEAQSDTAEKKGLRPLAQLIEEIFTDLIQNDLGYPKLAFQFLGVDAEKDAKVDADTKQVLLFSGQRTVNELRTDEGLDPIEGGDRLFVSNGAGITYIDQEAQDQAAAAATAIQGGSPGTSADDNATKPNEQASGKGDSADANVNKLADLVTELRSFRKYAVNRTKLGKKFRPFESNVLPQVATDELNRRLQDASGVDEIRTIFKEYMQDYQVDFLANIVELRDSLMRAS